jgi:hypothetical protein
MVPYCRHSNVATEGELRHLVRELMNVAIAYVMGGLSG